MGSIVTSVDGSGLVPEATTAAKRGHDEATVLWTAGVESSAHLRGAGQGNRASRLGWLAVDPHRVIHIAFLTGFHNCVGAHLSWSAAFARDIRRERAFTTRRIGVLDDLYQPDSSTGPAAGLRTAPAAQRRIGRAPTSGPDARTPPGEPTRSATPPAGPHVVSERFDVSVVGTSAAPAALAHTLTPIGKRILQLERGMLLTRELGTVSRAGVRRWRAHIAPIPGTTVGGTPFQPQVHYFVGAGHQARHSMTSSARSPRSAS